MQENTQVSTTPPLSGADAVDQINKALQTIATNFSGDSDPAALAWPYAVWADTGNGLLKRRNAANTAWVPVGPLFDPGRTIQVFDTPGAQTWTRPQGVRYATVIVTGGGGPGGGAAQSPSGAAQGGGGGAGGTAIKVCDLSGVESVEVTVAAARVGPLGINAGQPGQSSSFGDFCSATGGQPGQSGTNTTGSGGGSGGAGGTGVGGDINIEGAPGGIARLFSGATFGANFGGASFWGGGGSPTRTATDGVSAAVPGAGGSGANSEDNTNRRGGNGGPGLVAVIW